FFEEVPEAGVTVPGLNQRCPGDRWAQKWGMELGLPKCGILYFQATNSGPLFEGRTKAFNRYVFDLPGGRVCPKVDRYKYLGIWVDALWADARNPTSDGGAGLELANSRLRAAEGLKALHTLRPLFTDPFCPIPLKVMFVRNLIIPLMLYGSEWTAFRQTHAAPAQRVVNLASRWILGVGATNTQVECFTVCYELGIPDIEMEMAARRTRLHAKLTRGKYKMQTWLQVLSDSTWDGWMPNKRLYLWSKSGMTWIWNVLGPQLSANTVLLPRHGGINRPVPQRYADYDSTDEESEGEEFLPRGAKNPLYFPSAHAFHPRKDLAPLRPWAARGRMYEQHQRSNSYSSQFVRRVIEDYVG
ncbi:hypothetical protein DENSPDRAFT_855740, partial [Dentipellis sp. KUC8613]